MWINYKRFFPNLTHTAIGFNIEAIKPYNPSALETLCTIFKLSSFEQYILLLCVGIELDRKFKVLCAKFHGHPDQNYSTLNLALATFSEPNFRVFSSASPLESWGLIESSDGQTLGSPVLRVIIKSYKLS
ncbi:hypothetical protein [Coleofasciculus sp. E1-EBD-02]|uniref:hypothetical protein n=1 Tax=Coleofasciculus sp. E1-EBD-02 TaxID=3068481 RepID=UPI0032FD4ED2